MAQEVDGKIKERSVNCILKKWRKLKDVDIEGAENNLTTDIYCYPLEEKERNLNISGASFKSMNISCLSTLHRSHSLNCNTKSHTENVNFLYFLPRMTKTIANHYRNINYHFRPAVLNGLTSTKIYCSCLVLTQNSICKFRPATFSSIPKHSKSMPALECGDLINVPSRNFHKCLSSLIFNKVKYTENSTENEGK